ncbi:MAK10-like protein [Tanacetum coccineum]
MMNPSSMITGVESSCFIAVVVSFASEDANPRYCTSVCYIRTYKPRILFVLHGSVMDLESSRYVHIMVSVDMNNVWVWDSPGDLRSRLNVYGVKRFKDFKTKPRSLNSTQHLKDFLKLVDSLDLDGDNRKRMRLCLFQFSLRDQASNWLERLPAGSITTWEDLTTQFLAQFFPPGRTVKLCNDILIGPHDTQYCMEDPEKPLLNTHPRVPMKREVSGILLSPSKTIFMTPTSHHGEVAQTLGLVIDFMASQDTRLSKFEANFKQQQSEMTNKIDTVLKAITDRIASTLPSAMVKNPKLSTYPVLSACSYPTKDPQCSTQTHVPQSSNTELICTKEEDGDVMFIEIVPKDDNSHNEEPEAGEQEVEYF